jgi:SAM-dependent methyltransferase
LQFTDGAAYERFMGRWSKATAPAFLDWLAVSPGARWLDVGCGTGILSEAVVQRCAPASVAAVDPSQAQIDAAAQGPVADRVRFQVADAQQLPFAAATFDVVASALVINFLPDRALALAEMFRVARPHGLVAAYVWDFAGELSPSGPLRRAMRGLGIEPPAVPGADASRIEALQSLFAAAALEEIQTRTIDVALSYPDFDDFWQAQTPVHAPTTQAIAALDKAGRTRLRQAVATVLPPGPGGVIGYWARANAIKASAPAQTPRA